MSGAHQSPLEVIKSQIDKAVELVEGEPNEEQWPSLLQPVWVEAVAELIRYALEQEGRFDAAAIRAKRFRRLGYAQQHEIAARHGIAMGQFMRIVRTACGFRRSSTRPPPIASSPAPRIPRSSSVEQLGIVIDPRMRKINPR